MKYLCLCYYDAEKEAQLSQEELEAIGPACSPMMRHCVPQARSWYKVLWHHIKNGSRYDRSMGGQ